MAHKNLNTFIDLLRNEGELKDIGIEVDPELEILHAPCKATHC